jgi:hypothetical protein
MQETRPKNAIGRGKRQQRGKSLREAIVITEKTDFPLRKIYRKKDDRSL